MKKNIMILIALFIFNNKTKAQICEYDTCDVIKQYAGEWRYVNGLDTIRVYLRYHQYERLGGRYDNCYEVHDALFGWYERKYGANTLVGDYNKRFLNLPFDMDDPYWTIASPSIDLRMRYNGCDNNILLLTGGIDLLQTNPEATYVVQLSFNPSNTIMYWHQYWDSWGRINKQWQYSYLPTDFTLIKQ